MPKIIPDWQLDRITTPLVRVVLRSRGYVVTDDVLCRLCVAEWQARSPALQRHESVEVRSMPPQYVCESCVPAGRGLNNEVSL